MQVIGAERASVTVVEVVVSIAVEGSTEALRVGVVDAGRADRQAHPPVAHVGPDKGPGGKDQLQEWSDMQQPDVLIQHNGGTREDRELLDMSLDVQHAAGFCHSLAFPVQR